MEGYGRVDREDSLDCGESLVSREWGLQDGEWTHGELGFGVGQAGGERGELQERGLGRWVGPECGLGRSGQERSREDARVDRRVDCGRWVGPECGLVRSGQGRSRVDARVDRRVDC